MNLFKVCCEPCDAARMCCEDHSCCVECHFAFEEIHAFPHVPAHLVDQIRAEHNALHAAGYPKDEVLAHAEREMKIFRLYCPPEVLRQLDDDHAAYEAGTLGLQPGQETRTMTQQRVAVGALSPNPQGAPHTPWYPWCAKLWQTPVYTYPQNPAPYNQYKASDPAQQLSDWFTNVIYWTFFTYGLGPQSTYPVKIDPKVHPEAATIWLTIRDCVLGAKPLDIAGKVPGAPGRPGKRRAVVATRRTVVAPLSAPSSVATALLAYVQANFPADYRVKTVPPQAGSEGNCVMVFDKGQAHAWICCPVKKSVGSGQGGETQIVCTPVTIKQPDDPAPGGRPGSSALPSELAAADTSVTRTIPAELASNPAASFAGAPRSGVMGAMAPAQATVREAASPRLAALATAVRRRFPGSRYWRVSAKTAQSLLPPGVSPTDASCVIADSKTGPMVCCQISDGIVCYPVTIKSNPAAMSTAGGRSMGRTAVASPRGGAMVQRTMTYKPPPQLTPGSVPGFKQHPAPPQPPGFDPAPKQPGFDPAPGPGAFAPTPQAGPGSSSGWEYQANGCENHRNCPPGQGCFQSADGTMQCTAWGPTAPGPSTLAGAGGDAVPAATLLLPFMEMDVNPRGGGGGGRGGGGRGGGGRGGGGRGGRGRGRGGRGRHRHHGGGRRWWGGGYYPYWGYGYPYYYPTTEAEAGFDCIEFDSNGQCVVLKRQGADVNLGAT